MTEYHERVNYLQGSQGKYVTTYYGSQALTSFPEEVMAYIREGPQYVDITAGGGGMVFDRARTGQLVSANDRCYYAAMSLSAILLREDGDWTWPGFAAFTHPDNVEPKEGYLTGLRNADGEIKSKHGTLALNYALTTYVDGLLLKSDDPLIKSMVGKIFVNACTFRGFGWSKTSAEGIKTKDITPEWFWTKFARAGYRAMDFQKQVPDSVRANANVTYTDAQTALRSLPIMSGATVYSDPAWPWLKEMGGGPNPYEFFTYDVSAILAQREMEQVKFWEGSVEEVFADVRGWIRLALDKGAGQFILSTQGTNAPPAMEIFNAVAEEFKMAHVQEVIARSYGAGKPFSEWFAVYTD
jgi:hypothetical protein